MPCLKKNSKSNCKKTLSLADAEEATLMEALIYLQTWCALGSNFYYQREHVFCLMPEPLPDQQWILARVLSELPFEVLTDVQRDALAADGDVGIPQAALAEVPAIADASSSASDTPSESSSSVFSLSSAAEDSADSSESD